jgi:hypothetical protein
LLPHLGHVSKGPELDLPLILKRAFDVREEVRVDDLSETKHRLGGQKGRKKREGGGG